MTSTALRAIPIDAYLSRVRSELDELDSSLVERSGRTTPQIDTDELQDFRDKRRRPPDETLPIVAALYREALSSADPAIAARPTQDVATRLHYDVHHAARLVAKARSAGLLGGSLGPGRPGEGPIMEDRQ